jgi:quinoprotein glucose dehydrogenase
MRDGIRLAFLGILGAGLVLPQVISAQTAKPKSSAANAGGAVANGDWAYVGHDAGGMRYSPLKQINVDNVKNLRVAWTYHVGDISDGKGFARRSGFETTPILVDGTLFLTTPFNRVIALDPETGKEKWTFDPMVDIVAGYGDGLINRGVATWLDPKRVKGAPCRRRIFEATLDARILEIAAR